MKTRLTMNGLLSKSLYKKRYMVKPRNRAVAFYQLWVERRILASKSWEFIATNYCVRNV